MIKNLLKCKFMSKYDINFWKYLISYSNGKHFFKKMFKIKLINIVVN